jgi:multidrug efflux system membrane fusion protein
LRRARINLAYTKVSSRLSSGRIGKSSVTEGALVTNGQAAALATVQQLDPIYVDVTQSSSDFMQSEAVQPAERRRPPAPFSW